MVVPLGRGLLELGLQLGQPVLQPLRERGGGGLVLALLGLGPTTHPSASTPEADIWVAGGFAASGLFGALL